MNKEGIAQRDIGIDVLRLVACCAVVGLHTFTKGLTDVSTVAYYASSFAIPVFFMASGAFLLNRGGVTYSYVKKKLLQLASVLAAWAVVCMALEIAKTVVRDGGINVSSPFFQLFSVLQGSLFQTGDLSHCWFLWALAFLYVALPLLSRTTKKARLFLLMITVLVGFGFQVASIFEGYPIETHIPQAFRLWIWIMYFLLGGLLYPLRDRGLDVRKLVVFALLATALSIAWQVYAAYSLVPGNSVPAYAEYFYDNPIIEVWNCALFLLAISLRLKKNCWVNMATLCMGVYLIHLFVRKLVAHFVPFTNEITGSGLGFVVVLFLSFALVAMSKKYFPAVYRVFFKL